MATRRSKNSMAIGLDLSGLEEHRHVLKKLPPAVEERVVAKAIDAASKPIVKLAKSKAAKDTGALKRSITNIVRKYPRKNVVISVIGPDNSVYRGGKKIRDGMKKGDDRPAKYAHLVEFGHRISKEQMVGKFIAGSLKGRSFRKGTLQVGDHVPARPFLRPAVEQGKGAAAAELTRGVDRGVALELRRLRRKASKQKLI